MSFNKFLKPPPPTNHHTSSDDDDEDDDESKSLLWSASSSIHHQDHHYYETSSTSDIDAASTMSYATFHTVKEPEPHLIERGLLFSNDEGVALSPSDVIHNKSSSSSSPLKEPLKNINSVMLIFCLCISVGSLGLDTGIVLFLLDIISTEFQSSNLGVWVHLSYLCGCLTAQALCRNLTNKMGRKTLLVIAQCLFLVGSLSCSATQDMTQIIVSRTVAGLGGGMLIPLSSMVISDRVCYQQSYYEQYHLLIRTVPAVGLVVGPYIAGVIHTWIGWRYCFYINLLPCVVALCLYMFWLPNYQTTTKTQDIKRNGDYVGILLLIVCSISVVTGLSLAGNLLDWQDPIIIGLFVGGGCLGCLFIYNEFKSVHPIMPSLLLQPSTLVQCTSWSSFIVMLYLIPQFFMGVRQQNAPLAGLWLMPNAAGFMIATVISGWWNCVTCNKNNKKRVILNKWRLVIMALFHMGLTLLMRWGNQTTQPILLILIQSFYGYVTGTLIVSSLLFFTHHQTQQRDEVSQQEDQDVIISTLSITRTLGELLGIASASAILQTNLKLILIEKISEPMIIEQIRTLIANIHTLSPSVQSIVQEALLVSIQQCLFYLILCATIGLIATLCISTTTTRKWIHV